MEMNARFNYYELLEVSPFCQQHEVTSAYLRAKSTYSNENPAIYTMFSENEARDLLHLVEEAYAVLGNKTLRALYDEKLGHSVSKKPEVSLQSLKMESRAVFAPSVTKTDHHRPEYVEDKTMEEKIATTQEWSGELLKEVREYKHFTLEKMSEITKITPFYINALEAMESKNLPATVFVRGYVGQISKVLGLNEKKVCDSYMKKFQKKA
jgi:curved DNA-binding protein CbpA